MTGQVKNLSPQQRRKDLFAVMFGIIPAPIDAGRDASATTEGCVFRIFVVNTGQQ